MHHIINLILLARVEMIMTFKGFTNLNNFGYVVINAPKSHGW